MATSPFAKSTSVPGQGIIHLSLLPPATPTFSTLNYAYPLKLLPSTPHILAPNQPQSKHELPSPSASSQSSSPTQPTYVPLLFMLSYGGGLLPPDSLSLRLTMDPLTRLTITTQGSTKVFPSPQATPLATATQTLHASLDTKSGLLLAPDPAQPFKNSRYKQKQTFEVAEGSSLGLLDWVTEGRRARGEQWGCAECRLGCEVWRVGDTTGESGAGIQDPMELSKKTLLIRDNIILTPRTPSLAAQMDNLGLFGTLILLGPLFAALGEFFLSEFALLPRIGARDWGDTPSTTLSASSNATNGISEVDPQLEIQAEHRRIEHWRRERWRVEKEDGVLWTVARVRGCVIVKFGAREVEGGKKWLGSMWREEGSVERDFGPGGLMCVR
ncbi:hypothetical protein MMC13_005931 [Lambiella insularis]|nr:hypothetical protein [Lambiella insularis]